MKYYEKEPNEKEMKSSLKHVLDERDGPSNYWRMKDIFFSYMKQDGMVCVCSVHVVNGMYVSVKNHIGALRST